MEYGRTEIFGFIPGFWGLQQTKLGWCTGQGDGEAEQMEIDSSQDVIPRLEYRILIINNLVALMLYHRVACVDPPPGLLGKIHSVMVDFFLGQAALDTTKRTVSPKN